MFVQNILLTVIIKLKSKTKKKSVFCVERFFMVSLKLLIKAVWPLTNYEILLKKSYTAYQ